jgi:hypothetical protein
MQLWSGMFWSGMVWYVWSCMVWYVWSGSCVSDSRVTRLIGCLPLPGDLVQNPARFDSTCKMPETAPEASSTSMKRGSAVLIRIVETFFQERAKILLQAQHGYVTQSGFRS